jgi:tetratricopeptide (TPR) repeat protein
MFDRNGNVAVPAEYDRLGEVVNGMIIALKDAEEECLEDEDDEHSGCYKTGGNRMVIDTSNNVLIENFPDDYDLYSYDMYLDFLSKEKTKTPHPDTARESFAAKGGGYYSFINLKKEFGRWLANDLEAALKADMRDSGSKKFIGWHITDYWDDYITDSRGKINRREFIVRNYDNLIREARRGEIDYESFTVTGADDEGGHHSYYDYSRIGKGYELSFVTVRSSPLMLNAEIYRTLAKSYSNHHKEYYEAIVYYEKAIESDPDCAAEYYAMEESGKKKGEKAKWEKASGEAAEYFRRIIKPDPAQCAASFYDMGEAYIKNGDESKGRVFKKKAEALGCTPD